MIWGKRYKPQVQYIHLLWKQEFHRTFNQLGNKVIHLSIEPIHQIVV